MAQITVYTTDPCSFCVRVKQLLTQRGVAYEEINLSKDPQGRALCGRSQCLANGP